MGRIEADSRLMLHGGDDQEARSVSEISRTNHRVVSVPMSVHAGFRNLQEQRYFYSACPTLTSSEVASEDQLNQLAFGWTRLEHCPVE